MSCPLVAGVVMPVWCLKHLHLHAHADNKPCIRLVAQCSMPKGVGWNRPAKVSLVVAEVGLQDGIMGNGCSKQVEHACVLGMAQQRSGHSHGCVVQVVFHVCFCITLLPEANDATL